MRVIAFTYFSFFKFQKKKKLFVRNFWPELMLKSAQTKLQFTNQKIRETWRVYKNRGKKYLNSSLKCRENGYFFIIFFVNK